MENIKVERKNIDKKINEYFYIIDGCLSLNEIMWLYHSLIESNEWTLSRRSNDEGMIINQFGSFPGMKIIDNYEIYNQFFSGYFKSVLLRLKEVLRNSYDFTLPDKIQRIIVGAKNATSFTDFHKDSYNKDDYSIIGCLNPIWNNNDGGELFILNEKIDFKTGRFIIFPSKIDHNGGQKISDKLNYWRISVNIILSDS